MGCQTQVPGFDNHARPKLLWSGYYAWLSHPRRLSQVPFSNPKFFGSGMGCQTQFNNNNNNNWFYPSNQINIFFDNNNIYFMFNNINEFNNNNNNNNKLV